MWLSVTEYSDYRKVSISTVRRYLKSDQVKSKKENGKYLIYVSDENYRKNKVESEKKNLVMQLEISELKKKLRELQEENNDLKMLVKIYESSHDISGVKLDSYE